MTLESLQAFKTWLFTEPGTKKIVSKHGVESAHGKHPWWQVMCLTGVDYFSTLGYQPGIAFLAGGILSPFATLTIVLLTLLGALPIYKEVAIQSPNGQGSILILEKLFPGWQSKLCVLVLLGFTATDFIITITLSAADATAHVLENPFAPEWIKHRIVLTLLIVGALGLLFLKGFKEAIFIALIVVSSYLFLNGIVCARSLYELSQHPVILKDYFVHLMDVYKNNFFLIFGTSALLFPKLALGLSGFETGVAVMPLVEGENHEKHIKNSHKLLISAALIMSVFLILSSIATTLLIEPEKFLPGEEANGRALAYLAHRYMGDLFGTIYDSVTIAILGLAGASAMAGLLTLFPRYLPIYGMAPEWMKSTRPLVLFFSAVCFLVTLIFRADVDLQAGAYATGVLVLMTSASIAVTISMKKARRIWKFFACALISIVFIYTTVLNVFERPEGIRISFCFIGLIILMSMLSRLFRATELRINSITLDESAMQIIREDKDQIIRFIANRPREGTEEEYDKKQRSARKRHNLSKEEEMIFIEIESSDPSQFDVPLEITAARVGKHKILRAKSPAIANAIAALLLHIQQLTNKLPHAYFGWTEGSPLGCSFRYLFWGEGDVAPMTREILRRKISDDSDRPFVHVG